MIDAVTFRRGRGRPLGSKDRHGRAQRVQRRVLGSAAWRVFCVAFGLHLRALREQRDIAASELAEAIGARPVTVLAWERGRSVPGMPTLVLIAAAMRCSVVDLMPHEAHLPVDVV